MRTHTLLLVGSTFGTCVLPGAGWLAVAAEPGEVSWVQTFSDEFDGPAGSLPDGSKWTMETGGGGWGNNELQTYTHRPQNASHDGDGHMVITARRENFTGSDGIFRQYTSARLKTQGKFSQTFGRFEARIKVPNGRGIWPAFWMLGEDIATQGWPQSGEIDIMEHIGHIPDTVHGTIHGPGYNGQGGLGSSFRLPNGEAFASSMHEFAVEWTPQRIDWFVDGERYHTRTSADVGNREWVFDDDFFMLLNLAVGGNWPGPPNQTTPFPRELVIDYVRVSERAVATRTGLDDGNFREPLSAWNLSGNAYVQGHAPDATPMQITLEESGDSALKMFGTFVTHGGETRAMQPFIAVDDAKLSDLLIASVRTNSDDSIAGTDNQLVMLVEYFDNYDQLLGTRRKIVLDGSSPEDEWIPVTLEMQSIAGAAYASVGFEFVQPTLAGGAAWVDGVAFGAYSSIPEPTGIALLFLGAFALTARR